MEIRPYQLELLSKAQSENIIAYLETGAGKTLISIYLLNEFARNSKVIFLAPTNALVHQQAEVIRENADFSVSSSGWDANVGRSRTEWKRQWAMNNIFVMTPQLLLNALQHGFLSIEDIGLLIFDECHHTQGDSPYAMIMKQYYRLAIKKPKIFAMTASPLKSASTLFEKSQKQLRDLQIVLDSKLATVSDSKSVNCHVNRAKEIVFVYEANSESLKNGSQYTMQFYQILEELYSTIFQLLNKDDYEGCNSSLDRIISIRVNELEDHYLKLRIKSIQKHINALRNVLDNLGPFPAFHAGQKYLSKLVGWKDNILDLQYSEFFEDLSPKVKTLIRILQEYHIPYIQKKKRCIVFVSQRLVAESLFHTLNGYFNNSVSKIRFGYVVGAQGGAKIAASSATKHEMRETFEKFRNGDIDVLFATNVAEEGVDIPSCHLVIIFDSFRTAAGYIQSRGRARDYNSKFVVMMKENDLRAQQKYEAVVKAELNTRKAINDQTDSQLDFLEFSKTIDDDEINQVLCGLMDIPILSKRSARLFPSGALQLLNWFANIHNIVLEFQQIWPSSIGWGDVFNCIKHQFKLGYGNESEIRILETHTSQWSEPPLGFVFKCKFLLDGDSCIIYSSLRQSKKAAKSNAAFIVCEQLYQAGKLDEFFLPINNLPIENENIQDFARYVPCVFRGSLRTGELYLTIITFEAVEKSQLMGKVGVLTCKTFNLESMDSIYIWLGGTTKCRLSLIENKQAVNLNNIEYQLLDNFQSRIWSIAMGKNIPDTSKNISKANEQYFVVPVNSNVIDWETLKAFTENKYMPLQDAISLNKSEIGEMLCATNHNDHYYFALRLSEMVFITNRFVKSRGKVAENVSFHDYFYSLGYENLDSSLPMVKTRKVGRIMNNLVNAASMSDKVTVEPRSAYFPQEVLKVLPITKTFVKCIQAIPSIIYKLEGILRAKDLVDEMKLPLIPFKAFLPAFYSVSAEYEVNYERLEILGDAYLKFAVSAYLIGKHGMKSAGELSLQRAAIVSNSNLYSICLESNLYCMLETKPFVASEWQPPKFRNNKNFVIPKKCADFIEALIGAYFCQLGETGANKILQYLNIIPYFSNNIIIPIVVIPAEFELEKLQCILNYSFNNPSIAFLAFSHGSRFLNNYEPLEFLGDAVLDISMMEYFYREYKEAEPGILSSLKSAATNNESIAFNTLNWKLDCFINADKSIIDDISKFKQCHSDQYDEFDPDLEYPKVLADVFEAVIGAVYIDSNFNLTTAKAIVGRLYEPFISKYVTLDSVSSCPMRQLNEVLQAKQLDHREAVSYQYNEIN